MAGKIIGHYVTGPSSVFVRGCGGIVRNDGVPVDLALSVIAFGNHERRNAASAAFGVVSSAACNGEVEGVECLPSVSSCIGTAPVVAVRQGEIWFEIIVPRRCSLESGTVFCGLPSPALVVGDSVFFHLVVRQADGTLPVGFRRAQCREIEPVPASETFVQGSQEGAGTDAAAVHEGAAPVV